MDSASGAAAAAITNELDQANGSRPTIGSFRIDR
jgi:hypothetical protein